MKLSTHFQLKEFTTLPDKQISQIQLFMLLNLCKNILEPIRDFLGCGIKVTSGMRSRDDFDRLLQQGNHPSETSDHFFGVPVPIVNPVKIAKFGEEYGYSVGAADVVPACGGKIAFEKIRPYFKTDTSEILLPGRPIKIGQFILEKKNAYWLHISNPSTLIFSPYFVGKFLQRKPFMVSLNNGVSYQAID